MTQFSPLVTLRELEFFRKKHENDAPPGEWYIRMCQAIVAHQAGYSKRGEWMEALRVHLDDGHMQLHACMEALERRDLWCVPGLDQFLVYTDYDLNFPWEYDNAVRSARTIQALTEESPALSAEIGLEGYRRARVFIKTTGGEGGHG